MGEPPLPRPFPHFSSEVLGVVDFQATVHDYLEAGFPGFPGGGGLHQALLHPDNFGTDSDGLIDNGRDGLCTTACKLCLCVPL